jgi:hypothetical protein
MLLQENTTNYLMSNESNFILLLILAGVIVLGLIFWLLKIKKKLKITINHDDSFIGVLNNHYYAIINVNLVNQSKSPIDNLKFKTSPAYQFLKGVNISTKNSPAKTNQTVIFGLVPAINNVIDASQPINIPAKTSFNKKNIIIDIQSRNNKVYVLEFVYLNRSIPMEIPFDALQIKQI